MDQLLTELKSVPGVVGAFLFNASTHMIIHNMPAVFRENKLIQIGKALSKLYSASQLGIKEVNEVSLVYEESVVTIRSIGRTHFLIVFFDPQANLNMLTMSLNLLSDDLHAWVKKQQLPTQKIVPAAPKEGPVAANTEETLRQLMNGGPMAKTMRDMQTALIKVMGPMAKIIFWDAVKSWIEAVPPTYSHLPKLIEILKTEIHDSEKFEDYQARIVPFIRISN